MDPVKLARVRLGLPKPTNVAVDVGPLLVRLAIVLQFPCHTLFPSSKSLCYTEWFRKCRG